MIRPRFQSYLPDSKRALSIGWNLTAVIAAMEWVKQLTQVDKLAKAAARGHHRIDRGLIVGKIGRAKIKGAAVMFPAANQVLVVRIVSPKTVGPTKENRFIFEVFDPKTCTYISKHFAYCTPATGAQLHQQRGFRVKMNDNSQYPQIIEVVEEVLLPRAQRKKKTLTV